MKKLDPEKLPAHLRALTERPPITVPVDLLVTRTYSPQQRKAIREKLGLMDIQSDRLTGLRDLGEEASNMGLPEIMKGTVLLSQDAITAAIAAASNIVTDTTGIHSATAKADAGRAIGYLVDKLAKLNLAAAKVDQTVCEVVIAADRYRRGSFAPGQAIAPRPVTAKPAEQTVEV